MARITINPIAGALGAEIDGVDIAAGLDAETVAELRRALLDHLVIFFHGQEAVTPDSFISVKRQIADAESAR